MQHDMLFALWFLLPAALANASPIGAKHIPLLSHWNSPADGGRVFRGKELLGPHKTWRGFITGIITATAVLWLQKWAMQHVSWAHNEFGTAIDYTQLPVLLAGPLFGLGALGGDALKSFAKRQRGIPSGQSWVPFDQLDYILGGTLVSLPFVILPGMVYAWIFLLWFLLHLLASWIGWLIGVKHQPI